MSDLEPTQPDSSHNEDLREEVLARLCLMDLNGLGPARAAWLTGGGPVAPVIAALRQGKLPDSLGEAPSGVGPSTVMNWTDQLRTMAPEELLAKQHNQQISLLAPGDARWPFEADPEPPMLLFYRGDLNLLRAGPALAIVGTRRCTSVGRTVAYEIGSGVGSAGVAIISGLALGIDGAAHRGALEIGAPVIGVVGSGLDVVYPGANRGLWNEVAERGLLLSEAPAGTRPARWRFPARNRMIAGLSSAVLVVESHGEGGALLTVDEAIDRDVPVMAVPGSVLSPASDGTNELLLDGAIPVRHAADVLGHLGFQVESVPAASEQAELWLESAPTEAQSLSELAQQIMAEISTGPVHVDQLIHSTGRTASEVLAEVQALVSAERVVLDGSTVALP